MAAAPASNGGGVATGRARGNIRRQVEQLADSDPDRVAQQLRSWMNEG